ncbi:MAG: hypothetical protein JWM34_2212 [Ilumatobacteraceae bacterium]|nr:hypothetical protein [Ilumatobacteraceae bacterium]
MSKVQNGRFTANIEGDFVVFVIGMRINRLRKLTKWIPVAMAMGPMVKELYEHPESGFLGARSMVGGRTVSLIQYWRSTEDLQAFAKNPSDLHFPAWRAFNSKVGASGDVGVYHETYRVAAHAFETIYSNMPVMGLAAARGAEHLPVGPRSESAKARLEAAPVAG